MKIQSSLNNGDYKKFTKTMAELGVTEYELVQTAVLLFIHNPDLCRNSKTLLKFMKVIDWVKQDLGLTAYQTVHGVNAQEQKIF